MGKPSKRRDTNGHVDPFYERRMRYRAVLQPFGLAEAFDKMPRRVQELFWMGKQPDPVVAFDGPMPRGYGIGVAKLNGMLARATFTFDGVTLAVRDYFAVLRGCNDIVDNDDLSGLPDSVVTFITQARPIIARWRAEALTPALHAGLTPLLNALGAACAFDRGMWTVTPVPVQLPTGKLESRFYLRYTEPQVKQVSLDGKPRPMYRAANVALDGDKSWITWTGQQLGRDDLAGPLPVYVQAHALHALRERVNLPAMARYAQMWLSYSLVEPKVIARTREGDLLIEYRVCNFRIGYLVATVTPELVAIRTFLLITMEGTPEARQLHQQLKLTRRDVEWLGLSDLTTFTNTDLRKDETLRKLLHDCGCGHLLELNDADFTPAPKPFAAEMRKYLRLAA